MATAEAEARFHACLTDTLAWEGGYSNDQYDPGGATMNGIIQTEYDAYRVRKGLQKRWVKLIDPAERDEIYRIRYWDEVNGDLLPAGVDLVTWDFGVNSGPSRGIKSLQRAVGVTPDGHMGEITMKAVSQYDPDEIINAVMADRRAFLKQLRTFWRFGKGWMDRCDGIQHHALAMAGAHHAIALLDIPAAVPHADADVQSASQGRAWQPTPEHTLQTPEGKSAALTTAAGSVGTVVTVAQAAGAAHAAGGGFDWLTFLIMLGQSEAFVVSVAAVLGGVTGYLARGGTLRREAA